MDSVLLDLIKFWHKGKMDNHEFYYKDQLESYQSDLLDSLDESQLEKFKLYKTAEIDFNEEVSDYQKFDVLYLGFKMGMEFQQFLQDYQKDLLQ